MLFVTAFGKIKKRKKMKIDSYSISGPISGICKQHAMWAQEGSVTSPLIYFQRPAWIKDDSVWLKLVKSIKLEVQHGFEVK